MNVVAEGGLLPEAATSGEDIRGLDMTDKRVRKTSKTTQRGIAIGASITLESVEGLPIGKKLKVIWQILTNHRTRLRAKQLADKIVQNELRGSPLDKHRAQQPPQKAMQKQRKKQAP